MLRIDLLPPSIARGRRNVQLAILGGAAVLVAVVVMFLWLNQVKANVASVEEELAEVKTKADKVRDLQSEAESKQADLDPIQAKIDFVNDAEESGDQFFDRFYKINEYIYARAQVTEFSISPPDSVSFTAHLSGTTEAGRFVLNLIRSPHLSGIQISGMPGGPSIEPTGSQLQMGERQDITFQVQATLTDPVSVPAPPSAGGEGGQGRGGMGGMGMEGPGGPGMMPPGEGPGGPPGGAPGGAPPGEGPGGAPPPGPPPE